MAATTATLALTGFAMVSSLVVVGVVWETMVSWVKLHTGKELMPIVQGLLGELALLGFIGIVMFAIDRGKLLDAELTELFETIHVVLFGVMVVFFVHCSLVLGFAAFAVRRLRILQAEREGISEDIAELEVAVRSMQLKTSEGFDVEDDGGDLDEIVDGGSVTDEGMIAVNEFVREEVALSTAEEEEAAAVAKGGAPDDAETRASRSRSRRATSLEARQQRRTSFIAIQAIKERSKISQKTNELLNEGHALERQVQNMLEKDVVQRYMRLFPLHTKFSHDLLRSGQAHVAVQNAPEFPFDVIPTDVLLSTCCCGALRRSQGCCVRVQREEMRWELQIGALRERFVTEIWRPKERPLANDFDFAAYLSLRFGQICAEIVEVPASTWLSLWGCLLLVSTLSAVIDIALPLLAPFFHAIVPPSSTLHTVFEALPVHSIVANVSFYIVLVAFIPLARHVAHAFHMLVPQIDPMFKHVTRLQALDANFARELIEVEAKVKQKSEAKLLATKNAYSAILEERRKLETTPETRSAAAAEIGARAGFTPIAGALEPGAHTHIGIASVIRRRATGDRGMSGDIAAALRDSMSDSGRHTVGRNRRPSVIGSLNILDAESTNSSTTASPVPSLMNEQHPSREHSSEKKPLLGTSGTAADGRREGYSAVNIESAANAVSPLEKEGGFAMAGATGGAGQGKGARKSLLGRFKRAGRRVKVGVQMSVKRKPATKTLPRCLQNEHIYSEDADVPGHIASAMEMLWRVLCCEVHRVPPTVAKRIPCIASCLGVSVHEEEEDESSHAHGGGVISSAHLSLLLLCGTRRHHLKDGVGKSETNEEAHEEAQQRIMAGFRLAMMLTALYFAFFVSLLLPRDGMALAHAMCGPDDSTTSGVLPSSGVTGASSRAGCFVSTLLIYSVLSVLPIVPIYLVLFRSIALYVLVTSVEHFRDFSVECVGGIRAVASLQTTKKSIRMLRCVRQLQLLTSGVGDAFTLEEEEEEGGEGGGSPDAASPSSRRSRSPLAPKRMRDRSIPLTPQERALKNQLRQIFRQLDTDGGGTIAAEELRSLFLKLGLPKSLITPQACDRVVATIDEDGNGEIEFEELSEWVLSNLPPASEHSIAETVDALFAMVDLDGSGSIDKDELRETLASLGFKLDLSELEAVFREVDTDMSGTIDKQELSSFLSKNLGDC